MNAHAVTIFIVAFIARAYAISQLGDLPISRTPQLEALEYLRWAQQMAAGDLRWPEYPEHAPGYSWFVGVLLFVSGGSLTSVRVIQAVLGSISCVLTARIAGRSLVASAYLPAGLLQALYAPFLYLDTALLAEPLLIFLILLAVDMATRAGRQTSMWISTGLALGAAAIVRPTALVLFPVLAFATGQPTAITAARRTTSLLLGTLLVVAPIVIQNWRVTGVPMIQAYGGMNVYLGNTPSSDGAARARLGGTWDVLEADATRAGTSRNEQDAYFLRRTVTEILDAPVAYLQLLVNKAVWLTQQEELRDTHSLYFFRSEMPVLAWLPGFGLVIALAAVGVIRLRDARDSTVLVWCIACVAASVVLLVVGMRYRAPLVPFIVALAGAGSAHLISRARAAQWRSLAPVLGLFLLVFTLANIRRDAQSRNLAEEWAFTGLSLQQEGDSRGAEDAYRHALDLDDRSSLAWDGLGVVLQSQGRDADARQAFERAVSINDHYALGWYHVAAARDRAGDMSGAILAYRRALATAPERTDLILSFGLMLHREGRLDEAEPLLQKAAARGEGRAHFALALTAMQRRDIDDARHHAREAARLMPDYTRAQELRKALGQ